MRRFVASLLALATFVIPLRLQAYKVHYVQQTMTNGVANVLSDDVVETGNTLATVAAPKIDGFIFTGWTIAPNQNLDSRTSWGRAYYSCAFRVYESITLTANYVARGIDEDGDGLEDGYERYWYGSLEKTSADDSDKDGLDFFWEIKGGTNPEFFDEHVAGGTACSMGSGIQYVRPSNNDPDNPDDPDDPDNPTDPEDPDDPDNPDAPDEPPPPATFRCIIRSEPEGLLFSSTTNDYEYATVVNTPEFDPVTTVFACWAVNGEERRAETGKALKKISFAMPSNTVEVVAFCEEDEVARLRLHWYGRDGMDGDDDDRDDDGHVLTEECHAGTNPFFFDDVVCGGVASGIGAGVVFNPYSYPRLTVRSEPEGALFATKSRIVRPGEQITTDSYDWSSTIFAYWEVNGERVVEDFGISASLASFAMPSNDVMVIAFTAQDASLREIYHLYGGDGTPDWDADGDGHAHEEEKTMGTNPLAYDESVGGGVALGLGAGVVYNPYCMQSYTIRSEPEGALFDTVTQIVRPGTRITTGSYDWQTTIFAYWTVNGVRQTDEFGVSLAQTQFMMPSNEVEVVAMTEQDAAYRERMHLYGIRADESYDHDGDGLSHAAEALGGTNPLFRDEVVPGGVASGLGAGIKYNPLSYPVCTICSAPEGALFATSRTITRPGTVVSTQSFAPDSSIFAYWTVNGVRQAGDFGISLNSVTFEMPSNDVVVVAVTEDDAEMRNCKFLYGETGDLDSDPSGDGMTHAEKVNAGMVPYFYNEHRPGGVSSGMGMGVEVDLQPHEQVIGAVIEGSYTEIFTSFIAGNEMTSRTFGTGLTPVVCDVNEDGRFDFVLLWDGGTNMFVNIGGVGNPEFEERNDVSLANVDLDATSMSKLDGFNLDLAPYDGLSCTFGDADLDGAKDLLVSDASGHIWYYRNTSSNSVALELSAFALQHKVWGGTFDGFANGLKISAVDWDDDGDLDCLCGTAEGKLILLRDPKVGRPTNLRGAVGVDNVLLTWDPNVQSRVRGYKVYRSLANIDSYRNIVSPYVVLPNYRDFPGETTAYDYKVTTISQLYTAGNSTPTINESPATEPLRVQLGTVKFFWNDVVCKLGENANVMLSIENSMNFDVAGKTQTVRYDPIYLRPLKIAKTGLTENVTFTESFADGEWQIAMTGGILPAGGGKFLTLVFETLKEGETKVGGDSGATVTIAAADPENPTDVPPYSLGDVTGDGKLDERDVRELARLKNGNGRKYTQNQLKAGDFNGNGKLDNADYQALRALLKEKGVL